jgi:hypothetical protein
MRLMVAIESAIYGMHGVNQEKPEAAVSAQTTAGSFSGGHVIVRQPVTLILLDLIHI